MFVLYFSLQRPLQAVYLPAQSLKKMWITYTQMLLVITAILQPCVVTCRTKPKSCAKANKRPNSFKHTPWFSQRRTQCSLVCQNASEEVAVWKLWYWPVVHYLQLWWQTVNTERESGEGGEKHINKTGTAGNHVWKWVCRRGGMGTSPSP